MRQGLRLVRTDAKPSAWIKHRPVLTFLALAIGSVLAATGLAPSAMGQGGHHRHRHHGKPDLKIARAEVQGPRYLIKGGSDEVSFHFEDVTKNVGNATAPPSRTGLWLVPLHQGRGTVRYFIAGRDVSKLRPSDSDRGRGRGSTGTGLQLGAYVLKVCADSRDPITGGRGRVRESSERNNCSTGRRFYVIKRTWDGSLSGRGGIGSAAGAERWHSTGAHLSFQEYLGDGVFRYSFGGIVHWTDDGVNTIGCHLDGGGTKAVDEGNSGPGVKLEYGDAVYLGTESLQARFYTIYQSGTDMFGDDCAANPLVGGPSNVDFLQIHRRSLVFDQNELTGSSPGDTPLGIWRWDFH
jgi:hypothetical protein